MHISDYFFFKENCSYHLLALLEYADPSLHLTDQFTFWTVPADTVRLIAAQPGLVSEIAYRPSRRTTISTEARESLSFGERDQSARITANVEEITSPAFAELSQPRQAFLLDLASDYLRYRIETTDSPPQELEERNRAVLTARSQLRIPSEPFSVVPFAKQPELGHDTRGPAVGPAGGTTIHSKSSRCARAITICSIRRSGIRRMRRLTAGLGQPASL